MSEDGSGQSQTSDGDTATSNAEEGYGTRERKWVCGDVVLPVMVVEGVFLAKVMVFVTM